jgi:glutamate synthase (NADPH/NADH) large chain
VKEILASIGVKSLADVVGRSDLLHQVSRGSPHLDDLDLNPILVRPDVGGWPTRCTLAEGDARGAGHLDAQMIHDARRRWKTARRCSCPTTSATCSAPSAPDVAHIVTRFGIDRGCPGHITVLLRGSAGQSLGAFAVQGLKLEVQGDANDYVGKGLSGGLITIRPSISSKLESHKNTIIGNTVLYGATGASCSRRTGGGALRGAQLGRRAVVEGCGSNGCEYMTGGFVVIWGGRPQLRGGMTGGMAFVYDPDDRLEERLTPVR